MPRRAAVSPREIARPRIVRAQDRSARARNAGVRGSVVGRARCGPMNRSNGDGMVWRANVRQVTGQTRHRAMGREGARDLPHACTLRITPDGSGGVLLLRFDERGRGITDTWHETAAAAKGKRVPSTACRRATGSSRRTDVASVRAGSSRSPYTTPDDVYALACRRRERSDPRLRALRRHLRGHASSRDRSTRSSRQAAPGVVPEHRRHSSRSAGRVARQRPRSGQSRSALNRASSSERAGGRRHASRLRQEPERLAEDGLDVRRG